MADDVDAAGGGEGLPQPPENDLYTTYVDTLIKEVTPNKPKEKKFSIKFDNFHQKWVMMLNHLNFRALGMSGG